MPFSTPRRLALLVACVLGGLAAGFFYTYSVSVMPGLEAAGPEAAVPAMQGINAVIRNVLFAVVFFGTLAIGMLTCVLLALRPRGPALALVLAATVAYAIGVFGVTFSIHVPLNEALARQAPSADTAAGIWSGFIASWIGWNHVRALSSLAAFALFLTALLVDAAPPADPVTRAAPAGAEV